jgi:hypothetical protein
VVGAREGVVDDGARRGEDFLGAACALEFAVGCGLVQTRHDALSGESASQGHQLPAGAAE